MILLPFSARAASCANLGWTVIFVNGVLTDEDSAKIQRQDLENTLPSGINKEPIYVRLGHNQTHLGGGADIIQTASQAFGKSVSDFDQNTILMQIQPQISTRKILLVGHSQGTFYTNSIYEYLLKNGVPEESLAVYNLATPADRVEGSGKYLTSTNDKVINGVRPLMAKYGAPAPLSANITIPIPANELNDPAGGHHFGSSYLAMEPGRIVSDIASALGNLKAGASPTADGCFTPPPPTLAYKTQAVAFAAADPIAQTVKTGTIAAGSALAAAARKAQAAALYAASKIQSALSYLFKTLPRANASNQGAAAASALTIPPPIANPPAKTIAAAPVPAQTINTAPKTETPPPATIVKAPVPPVIAVDQGAKSADPLAGSPPPTPPPAIQPQIPQTLGPALVDIAPGFGGGGAAPVPSQIAAETEAPAPSITVPLFVQAPQNGALFATSSVTLSGTTTPGFSVVASYGDLTATSAADSNGDWSITLTLPEGSTSIGVAATDSDGNTSDAIARTVTIHLPPSAPSPTISECAASLSTSLCLIPTTSAALSWPAISGASYYAYALNGTIIATTTGTSAALSLAVDALSAISVASYDEAGNAATSTALNIYVIASPILINEIAWAGTLASSSDEWIELKNNSPYALNDLSHLALASADGSPYIQLSGALASGGYYLIERREEATSVAGDLILAFNQLANSGEELLLLWGSGSATTTIDATPAVSICSGWCSGIEALIAMTMERKPSGAGTAAESWQLGVNTDATTATDASGLTISGTPRAENSAGGEPPPIFEWM